MGHTQLDAQQEDLSDAGDPMGPARDRRVCDTLQHTATPVLGMESRQTTGGSIRRYGTDLDRDKPVHQPTDDMVNRSEIIRDNLTKYGVDAEDAAVFVRAGKPKTLRQKDGQFTKIMDWCTQRGINPLVEPIRAISKYCRVRVERGEITGVTASKYIHTFTEAITRVVNGYPLDGHPAILILQDRVRAMVPAQARPITVDLPAALPIREILKTIKDPSTLDLATLQLTTILGCITIWYRRPQDISVISAAKTQVTEDTVILHFASLKSHGTNAARSYKRFSKSGVDIGALILEVQKRKTESPGRDLPYLLRRQGCAVINITASTVSMLVHLAMKSIGYPETVAKSYLLLKSSFTIAAMELDRTQSDWRPLIQN
ncbi:hypothetical protein HDU93_005399 [Gonapodya sp. JEL0774]|nr:hypothetical protein HDU93_005399 [Gonapodya sp. JEL0774]